MKIAKWIALLCLVAPCSAGVFVWTGSVYGATYQYSWDSIEAATDALKDDHLHQLMPTYTGIEPISIALNLRGVPTTLAFTGAYSSTLVFSIPGLGITQIFSGATRDESQQLWRAYLKNNTQLLGALFRLMVKSSPIDPIAGNPNSLMTRSVQQDYDVMLRNSGMQGVTGQSNRVGVGLVYATMDSDAMPTAAAMKSRSVTIPLSYSHAFSQPDQEFRLSMPFTFTRVGDAKVYETNLSAYYRHPLNRRWILGGQFGVRATGSRELGSLGMLGGTSVMSSYTWGEEWQLTMGNLLGYNRTLAVKAEGASVNPGIRNTVYRNGLMLATASSWSALGVPCSWEWSWVDTRFAGSDLFNRWQEEAGITFGTVRQANARDADLRAGFSYIKAQHARGYRMNFGVWF